MASPIEDPTPPVSPPDATALEVDPATVRQVGARIGELAASLVSPAGAPTALDDTTIGHPGLVAALNEFVDVMDGHHIELAGHLDAIATQTRRTAQRYHNADIAAAGTLGQP